MQSSSLSSGFPSSSSSSSSGSNKVQSDIEASFLQVGAKLIAVMLNHQRHDHRQGQKEQQQRHALEERALAPRCYAFFLQAVKSLACRIVYFWRRRQHSSGNIQLL
jgi:zinc transporter ZupT